MADSTPNPLNDLLGLFGGTNPINAVSKSVSQFQRGVTQLLDSVQRFNEAMEQMTTVAKRVNGLLDTVEEPIRTFVPQISRTMKAADAMLEQLSGPVDRVAPTLNKMADTFSSPVFTTFPKELGNFMEVIGDLAQRLQPLGQIAESAGSLFGLRPLTALFPGASSAPPPPPPVASAPSRTTSPKKSTAKKSAPAKKPAAAKPAKRAAAETGRATPRTRAVAKPPTPARTKSVAKRSAKKGTSAR